MSEKPPWRVAIEQFERSIGAPIEEYIKTDEFADAAASAAKSQSEMQRKLESSTTQLLHGMNLPAASDIAELRAEIAALEQENASYQEQVLRAYQKIKTDEAMVARAKKAMAIALTVLDDQGNPKTDPT